MFLQPPATLQPVKLPRPARRWGVLSYQVLTYQAGRGANSAKFHLSDSSLAHPPSPKYLLSAYCEPANPFFVSLCFSPILSSPLCFQAHRDLPADWFPSASPGSRRPLVSAFFPLTLLRCKSHLLGRVTGSGIGLQVFSAKGR